MTLTSHPTMTEKKQIITEQKFKEVTTNKTIGQALVVPSKYIEIIEATESNNVLFGVPGNV